LLINAERSFVDVKEKKKGGEDGRNWLSTPGENQQKEIGKGSPEGGPESQKFQKNGVGGVQKYRLSAFMKAGITEGGGQKDKTCWRRERTRG